MPDDVMTPWPGADQPTPHDLAMQALWHQSYQRNAPEDYAQRFGTPAAADPWSGPRVDYSQGPTIQPTAYDRAVSTLHGLVQATDPFGNNYDQPLWRNIPNALQAAVQAVPAVGGPTAVINAARNLLPPTSTGAEADLSAQQRLIDRAKATLPPRPTSYPDAVQEWMDAHKGRSPPDEVRQRLEQVNAGRQKTLTTQQQDWDNSLQGAIKTVRQSDFSLANESQQQPFATRYPYAQLAVDVGAPLLSLITGGKFGSLAAKAISRGQTGRALLYGAGGPVFGGIEGDLGQSWLLDRDLEQPPNTQAYQEAAAQLPKWLPEEGPFSQKNIGPYLSDRALRQAYWSGGAGALSTIGMIAKATKGNALNALPTAATQAPLGANALEAVAARRPDLLAGMMFRRFPPLRLRPPFGLSK
jgi:hypothetical protein